MICEILFAIVFLAPLVYLAEKHRRSGRRNGMDYPGNWGGY